MNREHWIKKAVEAIAADFNRSSDTHLLPVSVPGLAGVRLYLKDESTHPTGSLKHRLARSLFLHALCNGWIGPETTVVEASSGSTAVSEAWFAGLLGLPFVAVMPENTAHAKIEQIRQFGARCHLVPPGADISREAARLAEEVGGHFMDQFTYAERATDWRGNNNIAESIFSQMAHEPEPVPAWIVTGAGTGGTSATIGRYIRYHGAGTRLCVVDPDYSAFFDYFRTADCYQRCDTPSRIEGIGRQQVEPSFVPSVVHRMMRVPDAASFAATRVLEQRLGRRYGPSTGTCLWGAVRLMSEMAEQDRDGAVVAIVGDEGHRYDDTCFDDDWLRSEGLDIDPWRERLQAFFDDGAWPVPGEFPEHEVPVDAAWPEDGRRRGPVRRS